MMKVSGGWAESQQPLSEPARVDGSVQGNLAREPTAQGKSKGGRIKWMQEK